MSALSEVEPNLPIEKADEQTCEKKVFSKPFL